MDLIFLLNLVRRSEEYERLEKLKEKLQPADLRGVNHCVNCGFCCSRISCEATPDEVRAIAKFLKMNLIYCINTYFTIDSKDDFLFLRIVSENTKKFAGHYLPNNATFGQGRCIFLDDKNKCKIHKVKPKTAENFKCWTDDRDTKVWGKFKTGWENNEISLFGLNMEMIEKEQEESYIGVL